MSKDIVEVPKEGPIQYAETRQIFVHHIYLSEVINDPKTFTRALHTINTCGEHDTVIHHLNTPGGQVHTGVQYINAMRQSPALQICSLEAPCASMAAGIFLAGAEWYVNPLSSLMIHNYTGGVFGKGHEAYAAAKHDKQWYAEMNRAVYQPFLSDIELENMLNGEDLYFMPDEIIERLELVSAERRKEYNQERDEIEAENIAVDAFLKKYRRTAAAKKAKKNNKPSNG